MFLKRDNGRNAWTAISSYKPCPLSFQDTPLPEIEPHPLLDAQTFQITFPRPLSEYASGEKLMSLLSLDAESPFSGDGSVACDVLKKLVRDLFRHGGYKPTGRGKPASEYLVKAVGDGKLGAINPVVDVCNVVSLHSGLPISVVDVERTEGDLRVAIAPHDSSYVFNQTGQEIKLDGLLCLFDQQGPCANGVKDSQRTKTSAETTRVLVIIWGTTEIQGRSAAAAKWYRELLATVEPEIQFS